MEQVEDLEVLEDLAGHNVMNVGCVEVRESVGFSYFRWNAGLFVSVGASRFSMHPL